MTGRQDALRAVFRYPEGRFFVYGTLMFPEVVEALLDREVAMRPGRLDDFRRLAVKREQGGAKGPAAFREASHCIEGAVLYDITGEEQSMLDFFEAAAGGYELSLVNVAQADGPSIVAGIYEGTSALRPLASGQWNPEEFKGLLLGKYVNERIPLLRRQWREQAIRDDSKGESRE